MDTSVHEHQVSPYRMVLHSKLAVGTLDLLVGGGARHRKHVIQIATEKGVRDGWDAMLRLIHIGAVTICPVWFLPLHSHQMQEKQQGNPAESCTPHPADVNLECTVCKLCSVRALQRSMMLGCVAPPCVLAVVSLHNSNKR